MHSKKSLSYCIGVADYHDHATPFLAVTSLGVRILSDEKILVTVKL